MTTPVDTEAAVEKRATFHRDCARTIVKSAVLEDDDALLRAIVHALLAIEGRLNELTYR